MIMRIAALFSGAKDSVFAIHKAIETGHEIKYLVSLVPENSESYMFHHPNIEWTRLQSKAMEIPIILSKTCGEKEKELDDLREILSRLKPEIDGVVSGALASTYQKSRIDKICEELGLESLAPHWGKSPEKHWMDILGSGFEVIITAVACDGLGKEWLGRKIDRPVLIELKKLSDKHNFNFAGEGGEFESFVLDGPLFRKRLEIRDAEKIWKDDSGSYVIRKLELVEK